MPSDPIAPAPPPPRAPFASPAAGPDGGRGTRRAALLLAALGAVALLVLGGLAAWGGDPLRAWRALLVAFCFATPLAAGAVTWSAIVALSHGRWAAPLERPALAGLAFAPVSLLALVAIWLLPGHEVEAHGSKGTWLASGLRYGRDLGALAAFWVLAALYVRHRVRGPARGWAAALALAYGLVFSLLGFDLVMALDPHWYSALFGGYFAVSGLYAGVAAWTVAAALAAAPARPLSDLSRLVLGFALLTTYLMFSQLLPIWYEDLPHERRFLVPRMRLAEWGWVSAVLLALVYLGPLPLLLGRRAKERPGFAAAVGAVLLAGLWLERWWLVTPTLEAPARVGLVEGAGALGLLAPGVALALVLHARLPVPPRPAAPSVLVGSWPREEPA